MLPADLIPILQSNSSTPTLVDRPRTVTTRWPAPEHGPTEIAGGRLRRTGRHRSLAYGAVAYDERPDLRLVAGEHDEARDGSLGDLDALRAWARLLPSPTRSQVGCVSRVVGPPLYQPSRPISYPRTTDAARSRSAGRGHRQKEGRRRQRRRGRPDRGNLAQRAPKVWKSTTSPT